MEAPTSEISFIIPPPPVPDHASQTHDDVNSYEASSEKPFRAFLSTTSAENPPSPDGFSNISSSASSTNMSSESSHGANCKNILCSTCGQYHTLNGIHVYDYCEMVEADLLCILCRQPLINPLDTKCGHTFCTFCLKNRLAINAICPVDGEIINYLECQQASNLVKSLLDKLLITCPNRDYCEEARISRADLENHLRNHCRGTVIPCPYASRGCSFNQPRMALARHMQECLFNLTNDGAKHMVSGSSDLERYSNQSGYSAFSSKEYGKENLHQHRGSLDSSLGTMDASNTLTGNCGKSQTIPVTLSSSTFYDSRLPDAHRGCQTPLVEGVIHEIMIERHEQFDLGMSIVGGCDTPLSCIAIQEIYADGLIHRDGRLRSGDQIIAVNDFDLRNASHAVGKRELSKLCATCVLFVYREPVASSNRTRTTPKEEIHRVVLRKRSDKILGMKIVGKRNRPGLFILGFVPDGIAELDGRLKQDDRILEINGESMLNGTQESAQAVIAAAQDTVQFIVSRRIRTDTPDILRTASGENLTCSSVVTQPAQTSSHFMRQHPSVTVHPDTLRCKNSMLVASPCIANNFTAKSSQEMFQRYHHVSVPRQMTSNGGGVSFEFRVTDVRIQKEATESLGMSVAGGLMSTRGNTPVYVTNLLPDGVLARSRLVKKGDILLSINDADLLGLRHEEAVQTLKQASLSRTEVVLHILEGPETSSGAGNFMPSWLYWLQLPSLCFLSQRITLQRDFETGSLGFSFVGGSDCIVQLESGATAVRPQPVVKTVVLNTPAHKEGTLKCGDIIVSVNGFSLSNMCHQDIVLLIKECGPQVMLEIVSWPGTIV